MSIQIETVLQAVYTTVTKAWPDHFLNWETEETFKLALLDRFDRILTSGAALLANVGYNDDERGVVVL